LPFLALLVFFGIWPYLWSNPLQHLGEMLVHWRPDPFQELFLGKEQDPALYYFPLYFAVTMPVGALAATLVGVGRIAWRRDLGHLAALLWLLGPFVVMLSPLARDGVRYLYPALAGGCLVAAAGLDWIAVGVARLLRRPRAAGPASGLLGTACVLYVLGSGLAVHPYYLDYYNEAVGGTETVERKRWFEVAWWGEGLREAQDYVGRVAPRGAKVKIVANPRHLIDLRPDLVWTEDAKADYIIYNRMFSGPLRAPGHRVAYVVRAGRAPLAWVYVREP